MSRAPIPLTALEAAFDYTFRDPRLLRQALRHGSAAVAGGRDPQSNERLEFLGDRVLGLCVAGLLYETFSGDSVGDLARRHAYLVSRASLERIARVIDLSHHIETGSTGKDGAQPPNPGILADACEALIAALYLDGGLAVADAFIRRVWAPLLAETEGAPKDPKTALQEWAQGRGFGLPVYEEVSRDGPDHQPSFVVRVSLGDGRTASASGPSKRIAEAAAARALLAAWGEPKERG